MYTTRRGVSWFILTSLVLRISLPHSDIIRQPEKMAHFSQIDRRIAENCYENNHVECERNSSCCEKRRADLGAVAEYGCVLFTGSESPTRTTSCGGRGPAGLSVLLECRPTPRLQRRGCLFPPGAAGG